MPLVEQISLVSGEDRERSYTTFRHRLGRAILRTVAIEPTLTSVTVLGLIVIIRTFLSFTLQLEIEGRWPWQQKPT